MFLIGVCQHVAPFGTLFRFVLLLLMMLLFFFGVVYIYIYTYIILYDVYITFICLLDGSNVDLKMSQKRADRKRQANVPSVCASCFA